MSWTQNVKVIVNRTGLIKDRCTLLAKWPGGWGFMLKSTVFLGLCYESVLCPSVSPGRGSPGPQLVGRAGIAAVTYLCTDFAIRGQRCRSRGDGYEETG